MELGEKLRLARLEAGLSQRALCGDEITRNMLSRIENGAARPSMKTLGCLAARLGKPVSYFLEEDTVCSPNQEIMTAVRQLFDGKDYAGAMQALAQYRAPDEIYDREKQRILFFSGETKGKKVNSMEVALEDPTLDETLGTEKAAKLRDEVELLGAGRDFDMKAVRNGTLSPVFFGSALTTFGVEPFLEEFLRMTTAPLPRVSDQGEVDVFSPDFSAFVFKIQANMNKAHRVTL